MKSRTLILSAAIIAGSLLFSCSHHTHIHKSKPLPPGQAKKITGSRSAKSYAPGQQKNKH
jgi:hypothetical protein